MFSPDLTSAGVNIELLIVDVVKLSDTTYHANYIISSAGLRYNALSFIFLQIRELSWLQWHPFSVSSSPMEGNHHLSVLIKVLGEWTDKLKCKLSKNHREPEKLLQSQLQSLITASVEGPYGHESPYHLTYVIFSRQNLLGFSNNMSSYLLGFSNGYSYHHSIKRAQFDVAN